MQIHSVNPMNIDQLGLFCIRDPCNPGFARKRAWFLQEYPKGLRLKILVDDEGQQIAFIEYTPIEQSWRPVQGKDLLFIHCLTGRRKADRGKGLASRLIRDCIEDARSLGKKGVAVMTSRGSWMAGAEIFLKNGFEKIGEKERFDLLLFAIQKDATVEFIDWETAREEYEGFHLAFAHQCPWHEKSVSDLSAEAAERGLSFQVTEMRSAKEVQGTAPSGFGTFSLVRDRSLLSDHYISRTRFRNILDKGK